MFRRTNKRKNLNIRNEQDPAGVIREEPEAENSFLNIGNEAFGRLDSFPTLISNEADNAIAAPDETLLHYSENDFNNFTLIEVMEINKKGPRPRSSKRGSEIIMRMISII